MSMLLNQGQCKKKCVLFLPVDTEIIDVRHYLSALNVLISREWMEIGIYCFMERLYFLMSHLFDLE
jgi:hypothetical protein